MCRNGSGSNKMKPSYAALAAIAVAMSTASVVIAPAHAVPPTVTPSPGYDARLQQAHAAPTLYQPAPRAFHRRHPPKRIHDGAR
jgi:hypothetical protein